MRKALLWLGFVGVLIASGLTFSYGQTPLTNALNLRVKTDSNGYLILTSNTAGAQGPLTALGNIRLRTDANGYLMVTVSGGTITPDTVNVTTGYQVAGISHIYFVTSNFTTAANTNLQTITGLVVPLPANTVLNVPVHCTIFYSQATAAVADSFGLQTDTLTPSNIQAGGSMETALGVTAYGDATITNTTATAVVTGTPGSTATIFNAYLDAFVENPSGAATNINIMVKTSTAADVITVYRGSFCDVF